MCVCSSLCTGEVYFFLIMKKHSHNDFICQGENVDCQWPTGISLFQNTTQSNVRLVKGKRCLCMKSRFILNDETITNSMFALQTFRLDALIDDSPLDLDFGKLVRRFGHSDNPKLKISTDFLCISPSQHPYLHTSISRIQQKKVADIWLNLNFVWFTFVFSFPPICIQESDKTFRIDKYDGNIETFVNKANARSMRQSFDCSQAPHALPYSVLIRSSEHEIWNFMNVIMIPITLLLNRCQATFIKLHILPSVRLYNARCHYVSLDSMRVIWCAHMYMLMLMFGCTASILAIGIWA